MSHTNDETESTVAEEGAQLEFEDTIRIDTDKETLWSTISDPGTLTECVPGAEKVERQSKREYTCEITRGISHLTISLTGDVEFVEMNEPHWVVASGNAYDPKTHSEFDVLAAMEMNEVDDETVELSYTADVSYTGGVASLNTGLIRPIVKKDVDAYFENIRETVANNG